MISLITPKSKKLVKAIAKAGGEARFVGGCVRDTIKGLKVNDIDLATNLTPTKVTQALEREGIRVIPTGIDHGTITAVIGDDTFEITTLRIDKETDGRHAIVEFTDDWQADAARRDFTFNALYMDIHGKVYDYFGGQKDLEEGIVRFIGNAEDRINEDYLRILRYFRFYQRFGTHTTNVSEVTNTSEVKACSDLAHNLAKISIERIWSEMKKILTHETNPAYILNIMQDAGVLKEILPTHCDNFIALYNMQDLEWQYGYPADAVRRFAMILPSTFMYEDIKVFAETWKLSSDESQVLKNIFSPDMSKILYDDPNSNGSLAIQTSCFKFGATATRDFCLANTAKNFLIADMQSEKVRHYFDYIKSWKEVKLPIAGQDLLDVGIPQGKRMGIILRAVEDWWLKHHMKPNRDTCMDFVKNMEDDHE